MTASSAPSRTSGTLVSIVLPVFNESGIIEHLTERICQVMDSVGNPYEVIYVNDGSSDGSDEMLDSLAAVSNNLIVIHLSRNFGHQAAVHAGLSRARGAAIIVMDSDMQDNPDVIPEFIKQWRSGFEVVYAERFNRKEAVWKRLLFFTFYRVLNAIADTPIPQDAGNFGLLDRKVVDTLLSLPEYDRFFPGLRNWVGFRQTGLPVERDARYDDKARVTLTGLFRLAKTAIFSFSTFPLTLFSIIAAISAAVCAGSVGFVLWHKLVTDLAIPGWASVIMTASFFGALNAMGISVLGEYVVRIYDQVRQRPIHLEGRVVTSPTLAAAESAAEIPASQEDRLLHMIRQIKAKPGVSPTESATNQQPATSLTSQ